MLHQSVSPKTGPCGLFLVVCVAIIFCCSALHVRDVQAQSDQADTTSIELIDELADPTLIFDRMVESHKITSFNGLLTYEQGGRLTTFSLGSKVSESGREERLELLDGEAVVHRLRFGDCNNGVIRRSSKLSGHYNFYYAGSRRVAGRSGYEIILSPVDKYRLGYRYVVDAETGLMLRSVVTTPDRRVVERVQYVRLDLPEETVSQVTNKTDSDNRGDAADRAKDIKSLSCDPLMIKTGWDAGWVPEGFKLVESKFSKDRAILIFSDGLSSMSVFVESVQDSFIPPSTAHRGATTVYINYLSNSQASYLVTVVGEVPVATAQRVVAGLRKE